MAAVDLTAVGMLRDQLVALKAEIDLQDEARKTKIAEATNKINAEHEANLGELKDTQRRLQGELEAILRAIAVDAGIGTRSGASRSRTASSSTFGRRPRGSVNAEEVRAAVIGALRRVRGDMSSSAVMQAAARDLPAGTKQTDISKALAALVEAGEATKQGERRGTVYRLA